MTKIHRKPGDMLQGCLFRLKALYEMLLSINFPSMIANDINIRSDYYAATSAHSLVTKNTSLVLAQFITLRNQEGEHVSCTSICNLVTTHESTNVVDKLSSILYLPESACRLDQNTFQASNVSDLLVATNNLSLSGGNKSQSPHKQRDNKYGRRFDRSYSHDRRQNNGQQTRGGQMRSNSRDKYQQGDSRGYRDSKSGYSPSRNFRSNSRDNQNHRKSYSGDRRYDKRYSRSERSPSRNKQETNDRKYRNHRSTPDYSPAKGNTRSSDRQGRSPVRNTGRSPSRYDGARRQSMENGNCMRCGDKHLAKNCPIYTYYSGPPCDKCNLLHSTRQHKSVAHDPGRNAKKYHIPDHRYSGGNEEVNVTAVQQASGAENIPQGQQSFASDSYNIFRKN